jgi:2-methylcitrate dehydratase PrpD
MAGESSVSTQVVSHVGQFRDGAWDSSVLRRTELCLLDSLSCFSAGLALKHFAPSATVASRLLGFNLAGSKSESRLSPFAMAYLYGQAANSLDYDDTLLGHPGAPIIGAVLSVSARERLSTDRLLRGIAAGYEAQWILCAAAQPSRERAAQVRSVGAWDTVAASLGVCVALGLEDRMMERVIGVAASHSLLPYTAKWYERPVPALKNNLGWVAAGAVLSTDLAIAGQTGVTNALDGDAGMWRMTGSDRWDLERSLHKKPAVLRVGFKQFPACWHLQEYLKTLSKLLMSVAPDDDVVEIVLAGPKEIERFCQPEILAPADIAFSLPATFSLLISRVEPGPEWDSPDSHSDDLRYRDVFRYERSEARSISLRMRNGSELNAAVDVSDPFDPVAWGLDEEGDPAAWGLDEEGVLAKHKRLTDAVLRTDAAAALVAGNPLSPGSVPDRLYSSIDRTMVNQIRGTEST